MAKTLLDAQLSLANNGTVAGTTTVTTTPTVVLTLGLDLAAAGANAQVHFQGSLGLTFAVGVASTITIQVTRGVGGPVVYEVVENIPAITAITERIFTFAGADYLPPAAFTVYQVLISSTVATTVEEGPLSFTAVGYSD